MTFHARRRRAAFVTIGQSPRLDLVPEMRAWIRGDLDIVEYGVLDGLDGGELAALAPTSDHQHRLVSRLHDGREIVVRKDIARERLQLLLDRLSSHAYDLVVLLCTGHFERFRSSALLVEAQAVVDAGIAGIGDGARAIGVVVPLARQVAECHVRLRDDQILRRAHASPYRDDRLREAVRELGDVDLVVLHCMGYTEGMRRQATAVSARPVLLARRLVASAVEQLL